MLKSRFFQRQGRDRKVAQLETGFILRNCPNLSYQGQLNVSDMNSVNLLWPVQLSFWVHTAGEKPDVFNLQSLTPPHSKTSWQQPERKRVSCWEESQSRRVWSFTRIKQSSPLPEVHACVTVLAASSARTLEAIASPHFFCCCSRAQKYLKKYTHLPRSRSLLIY